MSVSLVWLRRDLRLYDHAALATALSATGSVQPIFIFDQDILEHFPNPYDRRVTFIAQTLRLLHKALQTKAGGLLIMHGSARQIVPTLSRALGASRLVYAKDYEPPALSRDEAVRHALPKAVEVSAVLDHLLRDPYAVLKGDGTAFKVFTPYAKAWRSAMTPLDYTAYPIEDHHRYADFETQLRCARQAGLKIIDATLPIESMLEAIGYKAVDDSLWQPHLAQKKLANFTERAIISYKDQRDFVAIDGTSSLSPYLRFGLVSIRDCMRRAASIDGVGAYTWVNELIWRDFYAMILAHNPHVLTQEMQAQYRGLGWSQNQAHFARFAEGKTGFPIIDAAMRQLLTDGWMHNRARMIVASFMTKDLLLDWRLGEAHFVQWLMDYDSASNNGGWQWAASTGTDAQPYFRIFNPWLQSRRFDPEGHYIRRYVPELSHLSNVDIHEPVGLLRPQDYPQPMVEHAEAKHAAIALFKGARPAA